MLCSAIERAIKNNESMSPYTPEEIEERFGRLPEALKEHMMSVENSERIFEVGKKFGLTIEQIGFLAEQTGFVVLGLTNPNNFVTKLKESLRVDEEKAKTIAQAINHQVFFPLREILKTTHQFELTQEQIQTSPTPLSRTPPPIPPATIPTPSPNVPSTPSTASIAKPSIPTPLSRPPVQPPPTPLSPTSQPINIPPTPPNPPIPSSSQSVMLTPPATVPMPPSPSPTKPEPTQPGMLSKNASTATILPPIVPSLPLQQPPSTPLSKTPEGIKSKPSMTPPLPPQSVPIETKETKPSLSPLSSVPSEVMQKKFLERNKDIKTPIQSDVERMKESLFAPASTPAQPPQTISPLPPSPPPQPITQTKTEPLTQPIQPSTPLPYSSKNDPYREPIE